MSRVFGWTYSGKEGQAVEHYLHFAAQYERLAVGLRKDSRKARGAGLVRGLLRDAADYDAKAAECFAKAEAQSPTNLRVNGSRATH